MTKDRQIALEIPEILEASLDKEGFIVRQYEVSCDHGIHSRPSALLVKLMDQFPGDEARIGHVNSGYIVDLRSIMGLMTIDGYPGAHLEVGYKGNRPLEFYSNLETLTDQNEDGSDVPFLTYLKR